MAIVATCAMNAAMSVRPARKFVRIGATIAARGGNWRAPFRYNQWNVGVRLRPAYYNSRYYIADPYRYRLPRPGVNQRWVRHYNDVLLVNVRNGRVIQVHRGFFW